MVNYEKAKLVFEKYVIANRNIVSKNNDLDSNVMNKMMIDTLIHTYEVITDGTKVMNELNLHSTIQEFGKIIFLNHDIGRFLQIYLTQINNLQKQFPTIANCELGKLVLEDSILKQQIPRTREFDEVIREVILKHFDYKISCEDISILATKILENYELLEIFKNGNQKIKKQLISVLIQILQDVNQFEKIHQVLLNGIKSKTKNYIDQIVWDEFIQGYSLNCDKLKKLGLWNDNINELINLEFINRIKLLSTAQMIENERLISKLKEKSNNPITSDAYDIANRRLALMIKNSNGITVNNKRISLK